MRQRWAKQSADKHEIHDTEEDSVSVFGDLLLNAELVRSQQDGFSTLHDDSIDADNDEPEAKKQKVEFRFVEEKAEDSQHASDSRVDDPLNAAVGNSLIKHTDTKQFRFPWERGYLGRFFKSGKLPGADPPCIALWLSLMRNGRNAKLSWLSGGTCSVTTWMLVLLVERFLLRHRWTNWQNMLML